MDEGRSIYPRDLQRRVGLRRRIVVSMGICSECMAELVCSDARVRVYIGGCGLKCLL